MGVADGRAMDGAMVGADDGGGVDAGGPTDPAHPATRIRASSGRDRRVLDVMPLIRAAARSG